MKNTNAMKQSVVAIKSKADEVRAKLLLFSFMLTGNDKKKLNFTLGLGTIAGKIQSVVNLIRGRLHHGKKGSKDDIEDEEEQPKTPVELLDDDDEDKYPDYRHLLFEEEEEDDLYLGDPNGSVIDLVRDSKEEGESFSLENEIDHVADLFILKVHKNMRLQKLESFKRYQQLLQRSN